MQAPKNNKDEAKPRPSLIPLDVLIKHLAPAYEEGVIKYDRESWRGGFNTSIMIDSALRHISSFYYDGEDYDPDALKQGIKKHHLAGSIFSLLSVLHSLDHYPELDDRVKPRKEKEKRGLPRVFSYLSRLWGKK